MIYASKVHIQYTKKQGKDKIYFLRVNIWKKHYGEVSLMNKIIELMNIIEACKALDSGKKIRRIDWRKGSFLHFPENDSVIHRILADGEGDSQSKFGTIELLAEDWEVVEPEQSPMERSWEHYKSVKDYLQDTSYAHIAFKDAYKLCETHNSEQQKKIAVAFKRWCYENPEYALNEWMKYDIFIKQYKP